eukprot:scaffold5_cov331-Pavlova_lutheri.AAC.79
MGRQGVLPVRRAVGTSVRWGRGGAKGDRSRRGNLPVVYKGLCARWHSVGGGEREPNGSSRRTWTFNSGTPVKTSSSLSRRRSEDQQGRPNARDNIHADKETRVAMREGT